MARFQSKTANGVSVPSGPVLCLPGVRLCFPSETKSSAVEVEQLTRAVVRPRRGSDTDESAWFEPLAAPPCDVVDVALVLRDLLSFYHDLPRLP